MVTQWTEDPKAMKLSKRHNWVYVRYVFSCLLHIYSLSSFGGVLTHHNFFRKVITIQPLCLRVAPLEFLHCQPIVCVCLLQAVEELSLHLIKEEIKEEPDFSPEVMPHTHVLHQECIKRKSAFSKVKCPGCSSSFHASKSGLDALSHHIINSHRRHAKLYRHCLRFTAHGHQSDRKSSRSKRPNHIMQGFEQIKFSYHDLCASCF